MFLVPLAYRIGFPACEPPVLPLEGPPRSDGTVSESENASFTFPYLYSVFVRHTTRYDSHLLVQRVEHKCVMSTLWYNKQLSI